jgi:large subunit ribosomal protein L7/L12
MADLKAFAEQLVNLSVKEVNELAKILKEEYGIEPAAAAVAVAGPAAGGAAEGGKAEEKSTYSVFMNHPGGLTADREMVKDITGPTKGSKTCWINHRGHKRNLPKRSEGLRSIS